MKNLLGIAFVAILTMISMPIFGQNDSNDFTKFGVGFNVGIASPGGDFGYDGDWEAEVGGNFSVLGYYKFKRWFGLIGNLGLSSMDYSLTGLSSDLHSNDTPSSDISYFMTGVTFGWDTGRFMFQGGPIIGIANIAESSFRVTSFEQPSIYVDTDIESASSSAWGTYLDAKWKLGKSRRFGLGVSVSFVNVHFDEVNAVFESNSFIATEESDIDAQVLNTALNFTWNW